MVFYDGALGVWVGCGWMGNGFDLVVGYVGGDLQTFCGFVCCMVGFEFWLGCFMVLLCSLVCCWFGCLAGLFGFCFAIWLGFGCGCSGGGLCFVV